MGLCCLLDWAGRAALALAAARVLLAAWRLVFPYFVVPALGLGRRLRAQLQPGDWAVITGATDGIGKAYARELALQGANLVLVGRNPAKLQDVKEELSQAAPDVSFKLVTFDFAHAGWRDYAQLGDALQGLTVGVLVNSVGISYSGVDTVGAVANGEQLAADILNVNALSVTLTCRLVLEDMAKRGRGAIVNIASFSGCYPTPFLAIYAASKKYVGFLTESMALEYADTGVVFQSLFPQFVATKMSRMRPSFTCPTPENFARSAIATFGHQTKSYGCLAHALVGEIFDLLPYNVTLHCIKSTMLGIKAKQDRAKAKAEKAQ